MWPPVSRLQQNDEGSAFVEGVATVSAAAAFVFSGFRNGQSDALCGASQARQKSKETTDMETTYEKEITALLLIDPYNDFLSEGGKVWDRLKGVAEANQCIPHMLQLLNAAREAHIHVFYALHRRYRPGDYETWKYIAPIQKAAWSRKTFEYGTWGGQIRREFEPQQGDVVASEHWGSSGFANTDLNLQLRTRGIQKLIVMGLIAHTCVEATVRYAAELGYEVTMVRDATASYSDEHMHAALDINIPNYATATVTTEEIVNAISRCRD
jgi:nicotinamidase-related amidase